MPRIARSLIPALLLSLPGVPLGAQEPPTDRIYLNARVWTADDARSNE